MKENKSINSNLTNHPSYQSKHIPLKPTIKVNYKVNYNNKNQQYQPKGKKKFNINHNSQTTNRNENNLMNSNTTHMSSRVKSIESRIKQYASGKFIQSQYCPNSQKQNAQRQKAFQKAHVTSSTEKYQLSKSVENIIKNQYVQKKDVSCYLSQNRLSKLKTQKSLNLNQSLKLSLSKYSSRNGDSRISQRSRLPSYANQGIKDIIQYEHAKKFKQQKVTNKVNKQNSVKDKFRAFNEIHDFDFRKRVNTLSNEVRLTKGLR